MEAFIQAGFEVLVASAAANEPGRAFCERSYRTHSILLNDESFDRWLSELKPEVVIFDRFVVEEQFGWRVREASPESICILDTQDLHFLRLSREKNHRRALREGRWKRSTRQRRQFVGIPILFLESSLRCFESICLGFCPVLSATF